MAFCTRCGSNLAGAFCTQCGTPAGANTAPPADAPARRTTSPIAWVLLILLGFFCLGIVGVIGTGAYVAHRMRRAGVDAEMFRRDPQRAIARLVEAHPDFEFIGSDGNGITIRNRRTGKRFSLSFDDARRGRFSLEAMDGEGHGGMVEVGGDTKVPSWVPQYPGSRPEPLVSARGQTEDAAGEAGEFRFETPDSTSQVLSFYEDRAREMGLTMHSIRAGEKATLATGDEEDDRMLKVIAVRDGDQTTVNVTYSRKR